MFGLSKKENYWDIRNKALGKKGNGVTKIINKYKHKKLLERFNASIPFVAQIDGEPTFPHGLSGIFISSDAKIGKDCTIFHQVTIGSNTFSNSKNPGAPKIGDNVYIGCGAKIIGGISVGNNVRIGANCVVTEDVPDNSTVVLGKPRVIEHSDARDNNYIALKNSKN